MTFWLVVLASYLIGSLPFSYFFSKKIKGVDPRHSGTGNVGASNTLLVAGKRAALLALIGDTGKGIAAVCLARYFNIGYAGIALAALAVVLGHDFSVFLRFKGGKGIATTGGILLALDPVLTFLIVLLWILTMVVVRYFIPSTIIIITLLPLLTWLAGWRREYILFCLANAGLAVYAHRKDLQRFLAGQELTIQESMAKLRKK